MQLPVTYNGFIPNQDSVPWKACRKSWARKRHTLAASFCGNRWLPESRFTCLLTRGCRNTCLNLYISGYQRLGLWTVGSFYLTRGHDGLKPRCGGFKTRSVSERRNWSHLIASWGNLSVTYVDFLKKTTYCLTELESTSGAIVASPATRMGATMKLSAYPQTLLPSLQIVTVQSALWCGGCVAGYLRDNGQAGL